MFKIRREDAILFTEYYAKTDKLHLDFSPTKMEERENGRRGIVPLKYVSIITTWSSYAGLIEEGLQNSLGHWVVHFKMIKMVNIIFCLFYQKIIRNIIRNIFYKEKAK